MMEVVNIIRLTGTNSHIITINGTLLDDLYAKTQSKKYT